MTEAGASHALLNEFETMQNVGLGAVSLWAFASGFESATPPGGTEGITLWHLATVLPLVFHEASRRAISKRQAASGLRAILIRDPDNDIAQNEVTFNLNTRMSDMRRRTFRSLNCAIGWGLMSVQDGYLSSARGWRIPPRVGQESRNIFKCAEKLGGWAGRLTSFEYLAILGVEVLR